MSGAADRTALARFGFQDPDRREPLHDTACAYVAHRALDVARIHFPKTYAVKAEHEVPISKGDGKFKVTIGFADVVLFPSEWQPRIIDSVGSGQTREVFELAVSCGLERKFPTWTGYWLSSSLDRKRTIGIEVKWTERSVSDAMRQIGLYQEYTPDWLWVLASPHGFTHAEKAQLDSRGIEYLYLKEENVIKHSKDKQRWVCEEKSI